MTVERYLNKRLEREGKSYIVSCLVEVKAVDPDALIRVVRERLEGLDVQLLDAEVIAGRRHIEFALLNALYALDHGYNISKSLAVEIMLYASTQRQIQKAVELIGVKAETRAIASILIGDSTLNLQEALGVIREASRGRVDEGALEVHPNKLRKLMDTYNITSLELETERIGNIKDSELLTNLIIEKMALLTVRS
ncbi:MAG: KEOPS complex subunit Cgi121 [Candidatus Bathyarchaeia archaeon]